MKKLIIFPLAVYSNLLLAGGFSGGGPPPLLVDKDELMRVMQPDLGLQKVEIPADDFRRARARLSEKLETPVRIEGGTVIVKEKNGGLTDLTESLQLLPK